jgi:hypothetical protein
MATYFDAVHAFRHLTRSDDKGQKLGKINRSLKSIHTSWEGLDYFSVEIIGITGTQYLIEAYGNDAIELYSEMFNNKLKWDKKID